MSTSGNYLLAETKIIVNAENGEPEYLTHYRLKQLPPNNHSDGVVTIAATGLTESTFNLTVQQAVADRANFESGDSEGFTASDVFGGRI